MTRDPWQRARRKETVSVPAPALLPLEREISCGRMLAWFALQRHDETDHFVSDILRRADPSHDLTSQDRALAVDVSAGVLRRRRTIDTLLESQISRPRCNVEPDLWRLLQLGVYQVAFSRTPDHAAVDTTVNLTKTAGCPRWSGFVNGVLRNVLRLITKDRLEQPGQTALPMDDQSYIQLTQPVFPDPESDIADYTGRAFSLPRILAERWSARLAPADLFKACFYSLHVPTTCLRVNRLRTTREAVADALSEHGATVTLGENDWSLRISHAARIAELPGYDDGWWAVQDESAMLASELLAPQPGERILDLCAAPGGKTTHLAELSGDRSTIIACDVSDDRLLRVEENAARLQLKSIEAVLIDRELANVPDGPFDAVLLDVPCSNTGVLARRPEARWRFRESDLEELTQLQTRLLLAAYERLRPGGRMVYSTCSIEPEETTQLVKNVSKLLPDLKLVEQSLLLPGQPGDGAFQALLRRV